MKNCVFTIVAKNYIGLAQILEQSFKEKNPDTDFFIFVADEFSDSTKTNDLPANVMFSRKLLDISESLWMDMSFKYDLTEFCTSIKPAAFLYFLKHTSYEKIIYLDPDIYIYNSFEPVFKMLDQHSIVITPHIAIIKDQHFGEITESGLMGTGVFNLGFCAIKRSSAATKMVTWWNEKLSDRCYIDSYDTYFTDQKWMDFLPCFFNNDELLITRHLGMNIAPWNFFERNVFLENGKLMVFSRGEERDDTNNIFPVIFVHYSGYNYKELKRGNVIQNNITTLKPYEDIKLLTNVYAKAIQSKSDVFDKFIEEGYTYGTYDNGDVTKNFHRRLYRSLINKGEKIENPFSTSEGSFHSNLKKLGMTRQSIINVDKVTKSSLQGIESKLRLFNRLTRLCYRLLGFERYLLLIRLLRPFSRYESQIHLLSKKYDKENITF